MTKEVRKNRKAKSENARAATTTTTTNIQMASHCKFMNDRNSLTLKSQYPSLSERHGQVQRNIVLVVAHDAQKLKLELKQRLAFGNNNNKQNM